MQLLLFWQISKTLGTSAKNATKQLFPIQTTLTELTNTNTSRQFEKNSKQVYFGF